MKAAGLNLAEWLRRIGIKRSGWQPDFVDAVFPVQVVGDASALVSPLLPPAAFGGSSAATTIGSNAALQLLCRSPGGLFVRLAEATATAALRIRTRIAPYAALTTNNAPNVYNMGPSPVVSLLESGDVAAPRTTPADPSSPVPANQRYTWADVYYVPPGLCFYLESDTISTAIGWQIVWTEAPASLAPFA